jgi:hypothetical protein
MQLMILRPRSDGELAMSEFGDLEDLALLFGMLCVLYLLSVLLVLCLVLVCGRAVVVRDAHVH